MTPPTEPTVRTAVTRSTLLLAAMALLFTALLSGTHALTRERIAHAQREAALRLVRELVPASGQATSMAEIALPEPIAAELDLAPPVQGWVAFAEGSVAAVVLPARSRKGYGGEIDVLVAVDREGKVLGARVSHHQETPGLGDYIDPQKTRRGQSPWIGQFVGRPATEAPTWRVRKDGGPIDAQAGATISARAATEAIARGAAVAGRYFAALAALAPPFPPQ